MKKGTFFKLHSLFTLIVIFNFNIFATEQIKEECKVVVSESCKSMSIESCMKSSNKSKDLETCLGILLPSSTVPSQVRVLQSSSLFDHSKASCFAAVANGCAAMEISECMQRKGNLFPSMCRDLFYEIQEQRTRMSQISGHCFNKYFNSCQQKFDVPLNSYSLFINGLKSIEACVSNSLLQDKSCVKDIEEAAINKAAALEATEKLKKEKEAKTE